MNYKTELNFDMSVLADAVHKRIKSKSASVGNFIKQNKTEDGLIIITEDKPQYQYTVASKRFDSKTNWIDFYLTSDKETPLKAPKANFHGSIYNDPKSGKIECFVRQSLFTEHTSIEEVERMMFTLRQAMVEIKSCKNTNTVAKVVEDLLINQSVPEFVKELSDCKFRVSDANEISVTISHERIIICRLPLIQSSPDHKMILDYLASDQYKPE